MTSHARMPSFAFNELGAWHLYCKTKTKYWVVTSQKIWLEKNHVMHFSRDFLGISMFLGGAKSYLLLVPGTFGKDPLYRRRESVALRLAKHIWRPSGWKMQ